MELTQNPSVLELVRKTAELTTPKEIVWIDGSEAQLESLRKIAVETGELIKLNEEKLPGCYLNRSDINDVARVEGRTFICSRTREEAGPTNNWMDPDEMKAKLHEILRCAMTDRTMYVIPYSMGVIGTPFAKYGIEITDSIYVVLNMAIMTRIGTKVLEALGDSSDVIPYSMGVIGTPFAKYGIEITDSIYVVLNMAIMTRIGTKVLEALGDSSDVILGVHTKAKLDPENRYIVHFPEENKIVSVNSNYGGNVLQGKKCFSLRIASELGRREGWLAEHMLILGIENPQGEVRYVTGAFPSACGKTNLAMLIPPEGYRKNGWKCWTVGDDIAWLRVGPDGRLWAVNPENGFFGVAPGTSEKSNPNALASTSRNTIFTNVVLNEDDMTVWWEGMTKQPPQGHLRNWKGEVWDGSDGTRGAHPNSRFTAPAENCPCISEEFFKGTGVPISAIIFGGRRAKTAPLVYQSRDWAHGVFVGATMASETTAAATGAVGVVRRDPMAMRPFCGYNMADYWQHWLDMGKKLPNAPKIFNVNWFRTDDNGRFLWPGFGDNLRVLEWILKRCFDEVGADETPIGYEPKPEDINLDGCGVTVETLRQLLTLDAESWRENCAGIREYFEQFGDKLPHELRDELEALEKAFAE